MLLYELAIVLDKRSPELIEAGVLLGLGELQAASDLDAKQVEVLREHFGGVLAPPPLAPLGAGAPPPLPAAPSGPLVADPDRFAAPAPVDAGPPVAPADWGPPVAPSHWGPPPGATPQAPPPPAEPHVGPSFAYPDSPTAEVVASPLGLADATLPPPPAAPPVAPTPAPGSDGMSTGQKVLIGAVVLAVVALFGFMAMNTGPDHERQQALAAKEAELEAELNATTAPVVDPSEAPTTTEAPTPSAYDPVDIAVFCQGGKAVATFELRLTAAIGDQDFAELTALVRDRRAGWSEDVSTMASGAAPILVNDIELYRTGYDQLFDAVVSSGSLEEVYGKVDRLQLAKATNAADQVGAQIVHEC